MRLIDLDKLKEFPIRINRYDKEHGSLDFILGIESVIEYAENLPVYEVDKEEEILKLGELAVKGLVDGLE